MQGDFSRDSFDRLRGFSRVLNQQGRVSLDAEWNEMQSIQLHLMRQLAADLIGPHGGVGDGFKIVEDAMVKLDFRISPGRYYVDGWLCENGSQTGVWYLGEGARPGQPYHPSAQKLADNGRYLVYLDVWERHLSWPETDGVNEIKRRTPPALREVALGGANTASRAKVVWQVKVTNKQIVGGKEDDLPDGPMSESDWRKWLAAAAGGADQSTPWTRWLEHWQPSARGMLMASAQSPGGADSKSPCSIAPEARYRGVENQLYRVEIHSPGTAGNGATFKWSRENASVVFPVARIAGMTVELSAWWRDERLGLSKGDWVEVLDDGATLRPTANRLCRVVEIDPDAMTVKLDATPEVNADDPVAHPILRRWDHRGREPQSDGYGVLAADKALKIDETGPIALENGVQITFVAPNGVAAGKARYRTGDYWLIPARTAIADVVWPCNEKGEPLPRPPDGIEHHYAPLAILEVDAGKVLAPISLRLVITRVVPSA